MERELQKLADDSAQLLKDIPYCMPQILFPLPYLSAMLRKDCQDYSITEESRRRNREFMAGLGYNTDLMDNALRRLEEYTYMY
jgi:hypothetical protein